MARAMLLAAVAGVVLTSVLTPLLAAWARRRNYLDIPNHRSSHVVATPRIGGIALVAGVLAGVLILHLLAGGLDRSTTTVLAGALAIALLGLLDDFLHLPALVRLIAQIAVATIVVTTGGASVQPPLLAPVAGVLMVLWLVTMINAYNFMDGIDGIAGAQAVVAGCGWFAVGLLAGQPHVATLGLLLAAASTGFLLHNWHPAKVFMGDVGSGFFGFLFGALPLAVNSRGGSLWACAVLLMWPFLADTGLTLLRRALRGENVLSAHRSHLYQRLVLTGRSHQDGALVYAALALLGATAAVAVIIEYRPLLLASLCTMIFASVGVWWWVRSREAA